MFENQDEGDNVAVSPLTFIALTPPPDLRVDNVEAAIADLQAKGVEMLDKKPRYGAGGAKIAFLHPKSTGGILIEICEHPDRAKH